MDFELSANEMSAWYDQWLFQGPWRRRWLNDLGRSYLMSTSRSAAKASFTTNPSVYGTYTARSRDSCVWGHSAEKGLAPRNMIGRFPSDKASHSEEVKPLRPWATLPAWGPNANSMLQDLRNIFPD